MRQHGHVRRASAVTLSLSLSVAGLLGLARATAIAARPAATGSSKIVTLITGDRVVVTGGPGGLAIAAVLPGPSPAARRSVEAISLGGLRLLLPAGVLPFVGHGLSPSLFSVADLRRAERDGRLPVKLAFGGALPALPGIYITSRTARSATGYLTPASALRFGAALDRLRRVDRPTAGYGSDGLFAGGLTISLPGSSGAMAAARRPSPARSPRSPWSLAGPGHPRFPMTTLTITATDRFGAPDTGDMVEVGNLDNSSYFDATTFFYKGVAKLSVPVGHYWAIGEYFDFFDLSHPANDWRFVVRPQFTVGRAGATIRLSERSATSRITMRTPRPAVPEVTSFDFWRFGRSGPVIDDSFTAGGINVWVSPTSVKPSFGKIWTFTGQQLASLGRTRGVPYEYDLADADLSGLIRAQRFTVRPSALATVDARYFQDVPSSGSLFRIGVFPQQTSQLQIGLLIPFRMPRHQLEYMTGNPAIQWVDGITDVYGPSIGGQSDGPRSFRAGERTDENWNAYPLGPQANVSLIGAGNFSPSQPSASRAGNTLVLDLNPFSDNQPGHTGSGYGSGRYEIDDNGRKVAGGRLGGSEGPDGIGARARLSGSPSWVTLALTVSRPAAAYPLSPSLRAVWTWRSARQPRIWLTKGWTCQISPFIEVPDAGRHCAAQPLMMVRYTVAGLGLNGQAAPGPQAIRIDVSHLPLAKAAPVTGLTVRVSANDGRTWRPARVARIGARSFRATFSAPAGSYVTMRVRAADAAGGSVFETIQRGYRIARAGSPAGRLRPACPTARPGYARCFVLFAPQVSVNAALLAGRAARPKGWGARTIESAYKLPVSRDVNQTVAVVDAFSTPHLAQYLNVYRQRYGLPPCPTATGCLRIVNQKGQPGPLPPSGVPYGWDVETALDVAMVSAACPRCHILVVDASTPSVSDLAAAALTAGRLGAQVISNSYGLTEDGFAQTFAGAYRQPGHTIVVSSGDLGFGSANFPANLASVIAVGGTELSKAGTKRGWTERVWNSDNFGAAASGCSAYVPKPSWQHDSHCPMRTVSDVSAVASGVAMYDKARGGWLTVAGTSISAPVIAGIYGLAANGTTVGPAYLYRHAGALFDVSSGSNVLTVGGTAVGPICGGDYLCSAKPGYDAPTGLGTPDGIGAF